MQKNEILVVKYNFLKVPRKESKGLEPPTNAISL